MDKTSSINFIVGIAMDNNLSTWNEVFRMSELTKRESQEMILDWIALTLIMINLVVITISSH